MEGKNFIGWHLSQACKTTPIRNHSGVGKYLFLKMMNDLGEEGGGGGKEMLPILGL